MACFPIKNRGSSSQSKRTERPSRHVLVWAETGHQRICSHEWQKVWTSASGLCAALRVDWLSRVTRLSDSLTWGSIKVIRPEETAINITLVPCYPLVVSREQCCSNQLQCQTTFTGQLVNGTRWKNQIILSLRSLRNAKPQGITRGGEEHPCLHAWPGTKSSFGAFCLLELFVCLFAGWLACFGFGFGFLFLFNFFLTAFLSIYWLVD